jgi:type VI secretion system protein ImpJ
MTGTRVKPTRILWGEGLFLHPHHFQQQDLYHEAQVRLAMLTAQPFAWGVRTIEIDGDALKGGVLRVNRLDVVFPDGETYRAPDRDRLPPPVPLNEVALDDGGAEFHLAIHHVHAHGGNCSEPESGMRGRYLVERRTVTDLFTDAADAEIPMLIKHALLKASSDPLDQYLRIPLVRVRKTPTNGLEEDPDFMPPTLSIQGSRALLLRLRRLLDALQAKVDALYGFHREPSKNVIEFRSGDIASFWLLHTVSSASAALAHLYQNPALHPERLHQELLRLAGALLTFAKAHTLSDLPAYRHAAPGAGFRKLDEILRHLLETVISTRCFSIALASPKPGFHIGRLDSEKIGPDTAFYLSVTASQPLSELIESVPLRMKVGAPDDVEKLVLSAMGGVRLGHAAQVPPAIPVKPGACYFALDPHGPLYERMLKSQSVTIYTPAGYPDLKLDLIAVAS